MNFFIKQVGEIHLPKENLEDIRLALIELSKKTKLQTKKTVVSEEHPSTHQFHRMHNWKPLTDSVEKTFLELGFEVKDTPKYLALHDFKHELGDERLFLAAIHQFLPKNTKFEYTGDDGKSNSYDMKDLEYISKNFDKHPKCFRGDEYSWDKYEEAYYKFAEGWKEFRKNSK